MTETAHIEVKNVYKIFGPRPADVLPMVKAGASKEQVLAETGHTVGLRDVSLSMEKGKCFVVMGLSGSGKSTMIRHLNRLIDPTDGEIIVDGQDVMKMNKETLLHFRRQKMSMVFQRFGLMPHKRVIENVAYGLDLQVKTRQGREENAEKARHWIDVVGLSGYEDSYPHQLSGGMQQRVGLARALATDSDILLMDEAFSALDPLIRREMQDQLIELQNDLHKTIVFITHDLDEALKLGDQIAILKDGALVQCGTSEDILSNPADDYVRDFIEDVNRGRVLTTGSAKVDSIVVRETASPKEVLTLLKDADTAVTYVVDDKGKILGAMTDSRARRAAQAAATNLKGLYEPVLTAAEDMVLEEALPMTLECDYPLAVVDEDGKMVGSLSKDEIINALAETVETDKDSAA